MSKNWLSKIYNYENKIYSQGGQDGIIQYIIQNIEIPNKYCVEFNPNFPVDYAITFPKNDNKGWTGDKIFGASLKALNIVAINNQYTLVYAGCLKASFHHDAFFVRNDLIKNCQSRPTLEDFRFIYCPIHSACNTDRYKIMLDYEEFLWTNDIIKSQKKAENICKTYLC